MRPPSSVSNSRCMPPAAPTCRSTSRKPNARVKNSPAASPSSYSKYGVTVCAMAARLVALVAGRLGEMRSLLARCAVHGQNHARQRGVDDRRHALDDPAPQPCEPRPQLAGAERPSEIRHAREQDEHDAKYEHLWRDRSPSRVGELRQEGEEEDRRLRVRGSDDQPLTKWFSLPRRSRLVDHYERVVTGGT